MVLGIFSEELFTFSVFQCCIKLSYLGTAAAFSKHAYGVKVGCMFKSEGRVTELLPSVMQLFFSCTMCSLFFFMNNRLKIYPYFNLRQHWI